MPLIETGPRVVVSVTATGGGDWQVVSTPTGFQGVTSALFSDNDYLHGFVRFENGVDWEEYDTEDDSTAGLLQVSNISGTVTIARPATPFASSNGGARVTAGTGTHTLAISLGSGTMRRIFREINGTWKTFTSGDATPDVTGYRLFKTAGTTTITAFDNMEAGKLFVVQRGAADITIADGATISLPGDRNLTLTVQQPAALFVEDNGVAYLVATFPNLLTLVNGVAATELTIASGVITPTQASHSVDTEADGATDDLVTITATNFKDGDILILAAENTNRTVVLKHGSGNIVHPLGLDVTLDDTIKTAILRYDGANWNVTNSDVNPIIPNAVAATTLTIASGVIVPTRGTHVVAAESGTADDLTSITATNFKAGDIVTLVADTGDTITVKHNSGGGNIRTTDGQDLTLDSIIKTCQLRYDGTNWNILNSGVSVVIANAIAGTTLTIASGSITASRATHKIDGEGGAADDLTNIDLSAFPDGSQVMFSIVSAARPITVKTSGNITTDTATDISLGSVNDVLLVRRDGSTARASKISRDAPTASTAADVANVTALKAIVTATGLSDGARINLLGYTSVGDGGGGILTYIAASTATPDDFRVFKPNDVTLPAAGRFVRVAQAVYDWRQAGCVLDGSTDDAARANVAAADTAVAAITGGGKTMGLNYTSGGALVINRDDLTVEDTTFLCLQPTSTTDNRVVRNNGDRNTFRRCSWDWGTAGIAVGHLSNDALFWNTGDDCTMDQCRATGDRKGTGFANNGGTNFRCIKPIIENLRYSSTPTATTAVSGVSGVNLTVSSITGFTNGARIFVLMNDGGYYETSINGVPSGNTIVMANAPTRSTVDTTGGLVVQPSTVDDSIQAIWNNAATAAYIERPVIRNITGDIGFGQYNRFTRGMAQGGCNGVDIVTPFVDNVDQAVDNTGSAANKGIRVIGGKIQNVRTWGIKNANSIIDCVVDDVLVENAGLACVVYSGPAESGLSVKTSRCTVANSILKNPGWGTYFGSDAHACVAILKSSFDLDFPKGIKVLGVRGVDDQATTTARRLLFSDVTQRAASGDDFNEMDEFCTFDYSGDGVSLNAENVAGAEAPVCSIFLTADQSIPNAAWTEVLFTSEEYDPAQMHSTVSATGRIVIKRRGLYFVSGSARFANNATGSRQVVLRHESSNLYGGANQVAGHATISPNARAEGYRYCEEGDELYMWVYQDSGAALNVLSPETWLSAIRMPMNF